MTLKERIKEEEGLRTKPYLCPAKKVTIGYGHSLSASPLIPHIAKFYEGNGCIMHHMAEEQLDHDIEIATAAAWMKDSLWYKQVPNRAQRLIDVWLEG